MTNYLLSHRYGWGTTDEFGIHTLVVQSEKSQGELAAHAATVLDAALAGATGYLAAVPSAVRWNRVSCAQILNLSTGALSAASHSSMSRPGTSTSGQAPQVSVGISLTAGLRANGTPIKGRFYLPPFAGTAITSGATTTAGRITAGSVAAAGAAVANYFGALRASGDIPSVWSRKDANVTAVTNVRVGDVLDTIRSRRNDLGEVYTSVWTPV